MPTSRIRYSFSIALIVVAGLALTTAQPSTQARRPDVPQLTFEKVTLPNGLEVIYSTKRGLPMVAVNLWYHVGPAHEAAGRTGFAHLFEHMMFQSSKHVPEDSHFKLLEAAGASDINGTTGNDRTNYFETVPSNQLELALWLESDRMGYLLDKVDQASLSNQQDVVRNERRQSVENQPYGMADEAAVQLLLPKTHPYYGNVIGSHEDIQAAKLDDVRGFFRQYYAPNNATLAIVGDFDTAQAKALVTKYFGTLKRGPAVPPVSVTTPTLTTERRQVIQARVALPRVTMSWLTPPIFKPGDADADIAAQILGGGRSSRLYKKLVYEKQIAQNVSASQQSAMLVSVFEIQATARPGHTAEELEKAIDEELAAFRNAPPTAEELERARNTIETDIIGGLERLGGFGGIADRLNSYNHFLKDPGYLAQDIARYRAVSGASVLAFAKAQLMPTARGIVHAVPGTPAPLSQLPSSTAAAGAKDAGGQSINADEPWRNQQPKPGPARPLQLATPTTATLPNGLTLILSEKHEVPIVAANLVFRGGSDSNPADKPGLANFASAMLDEGTATRNALGIADELARLGASLGTGSSMDSMTVSARSLAKNFPATLDLLADVSLRPSFPADEIERQRAQRLGQLVQQRDNAAALVGTIAMQAVYGTRHPYGFAEIGTEASVKAMTRGDMQAFWKERFVPNNAALVVAGDITMPELRALADKAFGVWERGSPTRAQLGAPTTTAARVVIVDKPGSPQTQLRVAAVGAERSSPDFRPLQVMNTVLGGSFSSRINMNLREAHGYTYGAQSQFTFRRAPGPFQVAAGIRTDVTAPAVAEVFKEVLSMAQKPMTADELQRAKDSMAYSLPGAFESSANAVNNFSNVFTYDLGLDYYSRYAAQVNAVTVEQTAAVAKKYLVSDNMVVIAVGDRSKIEVPLRELGLGPLEVWDADGKPVN